MAAKRSVRSSLFAKGDRLIGGGREVTGSMTMYLHFLIAMNVKIGVVSGSLGDLWIYWLATSYFHGFIEWREIGLTQIL